jgi:hypothetical protein
MAPTSRLLAQSRRDHEPSLEPPVEVQVPALGERLVGALEDALRAELLRMLRDLRVEVVHQHAERAFPDAIRGNSTASHAERGSLHLEQRQKLPWITLPIPQFASLPSAIDRLLERSNRDARDGPLRTKEFIGCPSYTPAA